MLASLLAFQKSQQRVDGQSNDDKDPLNVRLPICCDCGLKRLKDRFKMFALEDRRQFQNIWAVPDCNCQFCPEQSILGSGQAPAVTAVADAQSLGQAARCCGCAEWSMKPIFSTGISQHLGVSTDGGKNI